MFDWLRKLFKREPKVTVEEVSTARIDTPSYEGTIKETLEYHTVTEKPKAVILDNNPLSVASYLEEHPEQAEKLEVNTEVLLQDLRRASRNRTIAERNQQRQQNTLGHGMKGKFKPRPAFEKRMWKLDKKPEEDS